MIAPLLLVLSAAVPADAGTPAALAPPPLAGSQYEAWVESLATEACTPGPVSTPSPHYPARALSDGGSGRVVLELLSNRCGDVRDAWVLESSGHRDIDRAAVRAALKWKLAPPPEGSPTGRSRVAIDFEFAPDA